MIVALILAIATIAVCCMLICWQGYLLERKLNQLTKDQRAIDVRQGKLSFDLAAQEIVNKRHAEMIADLKREVPLERTMTTWRNSHAKVPTFVED